MADTLFALADLLKINSQSIADYGLSDVLNDAPIVRRLPAIAATDGTVHKYTKDDGAPVVGFRAANDGRDLSASSPDLVTVSLKILDASFQVDKALADAYYRGADAYIEREAARHLKAAFFLLEQAFFSGESGSGFEGLADVLGVAAPTWVDATGTINGQCSSVYAIRASESETCLVAGNDGNLEAGESQVQKVAGSTTGTYPAYYTPIIGWFGVQIGSAYSVGRIGNLTAESGKGLTQDLLQDLLATFPASRPPTLLAMSRRSRKQLQQDMTTNRTDGQFQPVPMEYEGIPILATDAIADTEGLVA